jgi:AraC-like DNA-binding protein
VRTSWLGEKPLDGSEIRPVLTSRVLATDQPRETVRLQRPSWLSGVTFWTVTDSVRHWTMRHDTFTASLVIGPDPSLRAKWWSRGAERVVQPGCTQLMVPGETHRTTAVSGPTSFFVQWWSLQAMERAAEELGLGAGQVHLKHPQLQAPDVAAALTRLHDAVNRGESLLEVEQYHVESTTSILEHAAERSPLRPRLGRHHPSVKRAVEMLNDVFTQSVSLDELSREARISKFHFARCFRDTVGMAPHQYQKLLRLQAGRRLLESGDSVRSVASRTGFSDAAHFARAFRSWLGVSPSQWAGAYG